MISYYSITNQNYLYNGHCIIIITIIVVVVVVVAMVVVRQTKTFHENNNNTPPPGLIDTYTHTHILTNGIRNDQLKKS